jgi:O-antigen/teichoic acid export membrane protein
MPNTVPAIEETSADFKRSSGRPMPPSRSTAVARNTVVVITGEFFSRVVSFFSFLLVARYLGAKSFGEYSFIFSFLAFFDLLASLGMNSIVVREMAGDRDRSPRILKAALVLRSACTFLAILVACLVALFLRIAPALKVLICVASLGLLMNFRPIFEAIFRIRLKMGVPTTVQVAKTLLFLSLIGLCVFFKTGLLWFVLASIFSNLMGTAAIVGLARREIKPAGVLERGMCRDLLRESLPMLFSGVLTVLYIRIDVMMLAFMEGFESVGFYSAATRLTEALWIVPVALMTTLFPVLSEHAKHDRARFQEVVGQGLVYLTMLIIPIAILTTVYAGGILQLLFQSQYGPAAPALSIVVWAFVFSYPNIILVNAIIALRRQIMDTWFSFLAVIVNVALNLWWIPAYGFIGVVCEVQVFVLLTFYISRFQSVSLPWRPCARLLCVGAAGLAVMLLISNSISWPIGVPLFLVSYAGALFFFGVLRAKDGRFLRELVVGSIRFKVPKAGEAAQ